MNEVLLIRVRERGIFSFCINWQKCWATMFAFLDITILITSASEFYRKQFTIVIKRCSVDPGFFLFFSHLLRKVLDCQQNKIHEYNQQQAPSASPRSLFLGQNYQELLNVLFTLYFLSGINILHYEFIHHLHEFQRSLLYNIFVYT